MSAPQTTILVVEDDASIRTLLRNLLENEGFAVAEAANGQEMRAHLDAGPVQLITLDIALGGEDGLSLARSVRAKLDIPIIMISARDDDVDRIVGLELGADDYITKPFNLREVLARIRAVLRRYQPRDALEPQTGERFMFDNWTLDLATRSLRGSDDRNVELTTTEFHLLAIFVERPKRVLTRDTILDLLGGAERTPYDRSIDTLVGRLRKKIEPDVEKPIFVKTVRGVGYVFAQNVTRS